MQEDRLTPRQAQRLALSALLDGDASHADRAVDAWRNEPAARADWHAYQLIGEAMRSDDVRCEAHHDAAFLAAVRARLAEEPVVLAPAPRAAAAHVDGATAVTSTPVPAARLGRRGGWAAPFAVAAGFMAVAGVLVVTRVAAPVGTSPDAAASLAATRGIAPAPGGVQTVGAGVDLQPNAASSTGAAAPGTLIRSAELDRYLAAHRQYSATSSLSVPGGVARNVTVAAPSR